MSEENIKELKKLANELEIDDMDDEYYLKVLENYAEEVKYENSLKHKINMLLFSLFLDIFSLFLTICGKLKIIDFNEMYEEYEKERLRRKKIKRIRETRFGRRRPYY